jgi:hypothetical protein
MSAIAAARATQDVTAKGKHEVRGDTTTKEQRDSTERTRGLACNTHAP